MDGHLGNTDLPNMDVTVVLVQRDVVTPENE